MKKRDILKSNIIFNDIINNGKRNQNKYFVICSVKKDFEKNNYGIAVGKKVGNAVIRNKIKRQVRNIIDINKYLFPNFHNYIIICKKEVTNLSFKEMNDNFIDLLNKGEY
jgi:ribonuclease P protein component